MRGGGGERKNGKGREEKEIHGKEERTGKGGEGYIPRTESS